MIALVVAALCFAAPARGTVSVFVSSGGYLTRERAVRLEAPTAQGDTESICFVAPPSTNNVAPLQLRR